MRVPFREPDSLLSINHKEALYHFLIIKQIKIIKQ